MPKQLRKGLLLLCLAVIACGPAPSSVAPTSSPPAYVIPVATSEANEGAQGAAPDPNDDSGTAPIPVTSGDPQWGSRNAPVTIVYFSDFQCPFCARLESTFAELRQSYGPDQLRIVWKNNPLPFHKDARPAAEAAMAIFERGGNDAFWTAHGVLFGKQRDLPDAVDQAASRVGMTPGELEASLQRGTAAGKIDADMALGKRAGVTGTPASFVNGVFLSGSQPLDKFTKIINEQLAKAQALVDRGVSPGRVYAQLTREQWQAPAPRDTTPADPKPDDLTVYRVPIGTSPVRGKATALVTIVEFADYQCPFCSRVEATLGQVRTAYGDKVRLVYKHNPLPFHPRAEPAAELAIEARAQKGDAAFWLMHDALYAGQQHLDDTTLAGLAVQMGLNATTAMKAVNTRKHQNTIAADQDLADDTQASGTPHFFVNGRRLVGAQPFEKFKSVIDEELAKAEALVRGGVAANKVYERIMASGKGPAPLETKSVPAPTRANPSRGPANAKVVVQYFSDFECPFCKRVVPTLQELEKAFPGKIRIVWRNRPLPMHKNAEPAAEAAMEAYKQKGAAGFWAMHDLLFASQGQPGALDRAALEQYGVQIGLNLAKLQQALDTQEHAPMIEADAKIADAASISGTPGFVINGYYLSGAQPLAKFKKVVQAALAGTK